MMHERFCETCGMKLRSTPEGKLTQCCCCMTIDAQQELHDAELARLRAENARLKSAHGQMEQELNTLRQQLTAKDAEIERLKEESRQHRKNWETACEAGKRVIADELALRQQIAELVRLMPKMRDQQYSNHCPCESCHKICLDLDAAIAKHGEGE